MSEELFGEGLVRSRPPELPRDQVPFAVALLHVATFPPNEGMILSEVAGAPRRAFIAAEAAHPGEIVRDLPAGAHRWRQA